MKVYCVEKWGVYQQGTFGIYDSKVKAEEALRIAYKMEKDDYHRFFIQEVEINKMEYIEGVKV